MVRTLLLGVLVLAVGATAEAADDDAAKARAIIEKAVKAIGSEKDGPDLHQSWTDKGKFSAAGMSAEYTGKWWFSGPDKYRVEFKMVFGGMDVQFVVVANGDKAWESGLGQVQEVTGEKLEYVKHQVTPTESTRSTPS
jgi:outer membrane lipoprotein-sorting protein